MLQFLIEKEFKQIIRNSFIPKLILAMPLMMMLVLPWAANQEVKNVKLSVVDNNRSVYSERLVHKLASSGYFNLTDVSTTSNEAVQSIELGKADVILEIEADFEKNIVNEGTGKIMISANSINGTKGTLGSSYIASILDEYAGELRDEYGDMSTNNIIEIPSFKVIPQYKFNPTLDYKVFMVPALMVMLLTMLCGFLPALNIVGEKESGTIEQINVTPVKKLTFILSKLIPYWLIGFFVLSVCILLAILVYDITPVGSLFTIYLFATIYILGISGMGLIISNYSDTLQQAMFVTFFL